FFFSSRRRHTRSYGDWSSDVCSSDLLEKSLGVRVLERTTRRIALTSAGRLLYPHARRIGEETDAARAAIAKLREPEARPLRVVADPTYGRVLLSPLVPRFLEAFAHVP